MARQSTYPVILNNQMRLSVSDLKKLNVLKKGICLSRNINWKVRGTPLINEVAASIGIEINIRNSNSYMYNYRIKIEFVPSNIGKGEVPYLICPITGKKSMKLFFYQGYFVNRLAINNAYYYQQVIPKNNRKAFELGNKIKKLQSESLVAQQKYFRPYYKGFETKQQKRFLKACLEFQSYVP
jgi:hypothetical protein